MYTIRYWCEIIALPAFVFLVLHLSGHAVVGFLEMFSEHTESLHDHTAHEHNIAEEIFFGVPLTLLFIWIWHRPKLKKWIPCSHEHCHHTQKISHILAILALTIHFFPEAGIRYMLLEEIRTGGIMVFIGALAFGAHFVVDVLISIMLSIYWPQKIQKIISFFFIVSMWFLAFWIGARFTEILTHEFQNIIFLGSAFVLAMFIHKPHSPKTSCQKCDH